MSGITIDLSINDAKTMIYITAIEKGIPIMMWGAPGIGKSSIVGEIANECRADTKKYVDGFGLVDLRLPQLDPTDLRGIPVPNTTLGICSWHPPAFLPDVTRLDEEGNRVFPDHGILFLDEIEKAPVSVKNAALQLVLDKRIGDYVLPDGWCIVAAGNREEDGTFSQPLGAALENRMTHIDVRVNADIWLDWARNNNIMEEIIGFVGFDNTALYPSKIDADGEETAAFTEKAFPTPRTWHMGSTLMRAVKNNKQRHKLLSSCIGAPAAGAFKRWLKVYRNVNIEDILERGIFPENIEEQPMDFKYAITYAAAVHMNKFNPAESPVAMANAGNFLKRMPDELSVVFWRNLSSKHAVILARAPEFKHVIDNVMAAIEDNDDDDE